MTFVRHTHSYPIRAIRGAVCVSPSDSKEDPFAFLPFSVLYFSFQSQGAQAHGGTCANKAIHHGGSSDWPSECTCMYSSAVNRTANKPEPQRV